MLYRRSLLPRWNYLSNVSNTLCITVCVFSLFIRIYAYPRANIFFLLLRCVLNCGWVLFCVYVSATSGTSCADQCNTAFQSCFNKCGGYNDWNCLGGCQVVVDKCLTQCPAKQPATLSKVTLAAFSTPNCIDACKNAHQQCINDCGEDEPCQWRCEMPHQQCLVKCPAPGPIKLAAKANAPAKATAVATGMHTATVLSS